MCMYKKGKKIKSSNFRVTFFKGNESLIAFRMSTEITHFVIALETTLDVKVE